MSRTPVLRRITVLAGIAVLLGAAARPRVAAQGAVPAAAAVTAASGEADAIKSLRWRNIGPANQAGRISVFVGVPGDPSLLYVAGAAGGIFKSTNAGVTWKAVFDDQPNISIGAIALAPSDRNVIYVGTGEGNPRNSASFGDGMFKSVDAGEHWTPIGLTDTHKIARVVIDPKNAEHVYVCALGYTWGENEERGVFKTVDGGRNWTKILYTDTKTGCSDLDIDPTNANVVYAGMYTHRRWAWYFTSGGGQTALHKSVDGGATWTRLSGPTQTRGLPKNDMDRIGIAVAPSAPDIVYALSETRDEGMLWRSDDAGANWRTVNKDPNTNFRPFYYSDIRVDPQDPNAVYSLSGSLLKSEDGGRTFTRIGNSVHGDHQAMWIDPVDPRRVLNGSDGGFQISYDRGKAFDVLNNIAFTQFYNVHYDMQTPYRVCGGLQDNGTWCGPIDSLDLDGIRKNDWYTVGGGDGFFAVPDLERPWLVYNNLQGGVLSLTDTRSGSSWQINPYPRGISSSGQWMAPQKYRFNWNAPIELSPQDPKTAYYGGNVLFKTTSHGQSWEVISPDLTTNDKNKQKSSGGPIVVDNTAAEFHCTIITIAPSPLDATVIWVGTDDGNIQVTRDAGKTWSNVNTGLGGLAPNAWISKIDASHVNAGTAYVAASHWQTNNDYAPYFYKTSDYGKTWMRITTGMLPRGWSHVIREDPKNPNLLYAGTENGLYASWDGGAHWVSVRNGIPAVPVRDIKIHPREHDVIVATHGRGIYVLDDAAPLAKLADAMKAETYLFDIRPATRWVVWNNDADLGDREYRAPTPQAGASITYYLRAKVKDPVVITIADTGGTLVRTIRNAPSDAGVNRVSWDLRAENPAAPRRPPTEADPIPASVAARFGFGNFGPFVVPGDYAVTVRAAGRDLTKPVKVTVDPRVQATDVDLAAQYEAHMTMLHLAARVTTVLDRANEAIAQLTALDEQLGRMPAPTSTPAGASGNGGAAQTGGASDLRAQVKAAIDTLRTFRDTKVARPLQGLGYRQYPRLRDEVQTVASGLSRGFRAPNDGEKTVMRELAAETEQAVSALNEILAGDVARINQATRSMPRIAAEPIK